MIAGPVMIRSAQRDDFPAILQLYAGDDRERGAETAVSGSVQRERAHRFYERLGFQPSHKGMKLYLGAGTQ